MALSPPRPRKGYHRLWTLQPDLFLKELEADGVVRGKWKRVPDLWRPCYLWMAREMVQRGLMSRPVAPLWVWHSCRGLGAPPNQNTIDGLLGMDGSNGQIVELEVPQSLVLLSSYGIWNEFIDVCWDLDNNLRHPELQRPKWRRMFLDQVSPSAPWGGGNHHDIQATLPMIRLDWVKSSVPYQANRWYPSEAGCPGPEPKP